MMKGKRKCLWGARKREHKRFISAELDGEKTERGRRWSRSCYLIRKEGQVHRWSLLKVGWVGIWLEELSRDIRSTDREEDAAETCARRTKRSEDRLCLSPPPSPPVQLHVPSQPGGAPCEKKKKKEWNVYNNNYIKLVYSRRFSSSGDARLIRCTEGGSPHTL